MIHEQTLVDKKQLLLTEKLENLNRNLENGNLESVLIKKGKISISPNRGNKLDDSINSILNRIYDEVPQIKITNLLLRK